MFEKVIKKISTTAFILGVLNLVAAIAGLTREGKTEVVLLVSVCFLLISIRTK